MEWHNTAIIDLIRRYTKPIFFNAIRTVETFTSTGTFTVPSTVNKVNILMIGGGGGGARENGGDDVQGGGGAMTIVAQDLFVKPSTDITVTIGAGGAKSGTAGPALGLDGSNSVCLGLTALAGRGGGNSGIAGITSASFGLSKEIIDFTDEQYRNFLIDNAKAYRGLMGDFTGAIDDIPNDMLFPSVYIAKTTALLDLNWKQIYKYPSGLVYDVSPYSGGASLLAAGGAGSVTASDATDGTFGSGGGPYKSGSAGRSGAGGDGVLYIEYYR